MKVIVKREIKENSNVLRFIIKALTILCCLLKLNCHPMVFIGIVLLFSSILNIEVQCGLSSRANAFAITTTRTTALYFIENQQYILFHCIQFKCKVIFLLTNLHLYDPIKCAIEAIGVELLWINLYKW